MQIVSLIRRVIVTATRPWIWRVRPIRKRHLAPDPFAQFARWYRQANRCFWLEFPDAMCLATVDEQGWPDARYVLLKHFDSRGFVFYTNTDSVKGRSLARQPQATLTFYWEPLQQQVRIQGAVEPVSNEEADEYFASRPRGSRIGAWASRQSEVLPSRQVLEDRVRYYREKYQGQAIPRPVHWSGYRVIPGKFEFWRLRPSRLHDRFRYQKTPTGGWELSRLYP